MTSKVKPNRNVLISGGSTDLGLETAKFFLSKGYSVVICGRNTNNLNSAITSIEKLSNPERKLIGIQCDVAEIESVISMKSELEQQNILIYTLICNAGVIGPIDKFLVNDMKLWKESFEINLYGSVNLINQFLPSMLDLEFGRVIHISGGGATAPLFGMSSYASSKSAAVRFIETLALEYLDSGVTLNSIAPGMLKTKLLEQMLEEGPDRIGEKLYSKSSQKADSIYDSTHKAVDLIYFLASEENKITGKLISAEWDNWSAFQDHSDELKGTDLYTLRRIVGRDRDAQWGDI
jgi:NAD(P)-dependent dehydrogenase (short-subunit alcohol dehydrogenase family)